MNWQVFDALGIFLGYTANIAVSKAGTQCKQNQEAGMMLMVRRCFMAVADRQRVHSRLLASVGSVLRLLGLAQVPDEARGKSAREVR
jgi:hypothetical protein